MSRLFSSNRLQGTHVLLVARGEERELATSFLTMVGAQVTPAETLDVAWAAFERDLPSIVVCAIEAPERARQLIAAIRALPAERGGLTPAIAVAGGDGEALLMQGYHVHLPAPADPIRLVEILDDFANAGAFDRYVDAHWTVQSPRPGLLLLTLAGQVSASHMHAMMRVVVEHLRRQPCDFVVDLRGLTGFAPSAASVAERNVWSTRKAVRSVALVGGPLAARVTAAAACKMLGVPCTLHDRMPAEP
jgi:hypothetical protein